MGRCDICGEMIEFGIACMMNCESGAVRCLSHERDVEVAVYTYREPEGGLEGSQGRIVVSHLTQKAILRYRDNEDSSEPPEVTIDHLLKSAERGKWTPLDALPGIREGVRDD